MSTRADVERRLRRAWWGEARWLSLLLLPLSWLYRFGAAVHRGLYAVGLKPRMQLDVPVISIGNIVVGGAGKTPVTLELARRFLKAGRRVAVLSRGYGRRDDRRVVIVSDGDTIRATAAEGGDEPTWLARKLPGLIVVVARKRAEAAAIALDLRADLILLDDGFSHHAMARTADVLVVDAVGRLGNARLLPAGPLREPVAAGVKRANLLWLSRVREKSDAAPVPFASVPLVKSFYEPSRLVDLELHPAELLEALRDRRVIGVCGIARPEEFEQTLRAAGAIVRGMSVFPDHHAFTREEVAAIERDAAEERCDFIVTTEKDAVRLSSLTQSLLFRALAMEVVVVSGEKHLEQFVQRFADPLGTSEVA